ncbi:sporulation histidine kinase inhibitor Sda [Sporosarcina sp. P13]|nr:sporulation histidine kinase inhibitor Sda [Sporosarcina sp. P13]PIC64437.1 sporulation histidine kinase inhibitor Sda [Sporosarcina sp. P13]
MLELSDHLLLYSYQQARRLDLNQEFIKLLEIEIQKRALESMQLSH